MKSNLATKLPVIGFVARSGTGKTTFITQLIPLLERLGVRVAVVKHSHHNFEIDKPGKDSYRFRIAGARQTVIASRFRIASISELPGDTSDASLKQCLDCIDKSTVDLIIVEGFKHEAYQKIEIHRHSMDNHYLYPEDNNIIALVSDEHPGSKCSVPVFDISNPLPTVEFLISIFQLQTKHE